jgi:large subunit ribosomal protein L21
LPQDKRSGKAVSYNIAYRIMFAVIKTGGKQYKVQPGAILKTEKLAGVAGDVVELTDVLAVSGGEGDLRLGNPLVAGAKVTAVILEQKKDPKIIVFKKKRRHNYRRKKGHRQQVTLLKIQTIQ